MKIASLTGIVVFAAGIALPSGDVNPLQYEKYKLNNGPSLTEKFCYAIRDVANKNLIGQGYFISGGFNEKLCRLIIKEVPKCYKEPGDGTECS